MSKRSDRSEPITAPAYSRLTRDGRDYVAVGDWTDAEMAREIDRLRRKREAKR